MYNNDNTYNRMLEMTLTQRMYCKMFRALKKKLIHFNLFDFFLNTLSIRRFLGRFLAGLC